MEWLTMIAGRLLLQKCLSYYNLLPGFTREQCELTIMSRQELFLSERAAVFADGDL